ncbi:hypothetical protein [Streptomyces galbus]|uniref:Peptidoglycan binding domain-containing protein n=1 Tax=Streptomyces galbus TaxID=33898 RepID=A0A4U5X1N0_STRGB|nr:hypothetical protein [Streptomyces galbus]TKT07921.1 hypothetical protein E4U92_21025 [Streptomyces galbus]GHD39884.1 hypothetical protein GCM10010335_40090 [Streptomyces galbus]
MSRETDTPSSGPNGRGGAAYPSGTPPYGTPVVPAGGTDAGRSATQPEERKTETTLTTRIRINIPGSRPIPPVVVRKPVTEAEAEAAAEDTGPDARAADAAPPAGPDRPAAQAPADGAAAGEDKTSDWFAPRKSPAVKGGPGGGAPNGAGTPGGSAAGPGAVTGAAPGAPTAPGGPGATARPGAGRPGGVVGSMGAPGTARPGSTNGAGLPGATGGPVAPGHGGGTGSFDVTEAINAAAQSGPRPGQDGGEARPDGLPYFADGSPQGGAHGGQPPQGGPFTDGAGQGFGGPNGVPGTQGGPNGQGAPQGPHGPQGYENFSDYGDQGGQAHPGAPYGTGPAGPTTGPMTGPMNGDTTSALPVVGGPDGTGVPGAHGQGPNGAHGPAGPGTHPGAPAAPGTRLPGGGLSDDTAVLTPQKPADPAATAGFPRPDNVSGHTVTSGIPVVPPADRNGPFPPGGPADGPVPHTPAQRTEPSAPNKPAPAAKKAKKKGRSKLVLLGGLVVVAAVGAYGAGLLMNHSDVPKGTTVLGVDIGGGTRDDAVKKLDDAFDQRVNQALKLSVDGRTVTLKPDQAGLQFDLQATVDDAARSDYNPVSVIGTLFGQKRVVEPEMPVDEEKLDAALETAAGGAGSASDGTIRFESGKAVPVYGKAGQGIDTERAAAAVEEGYRTQVETGAPTTVRVPTTTKQPTVSNAEVDRMMKDFARPAMSAKVTVRSGTHQIAFSPEKSLWKFLRVKAVDGKLVDSYDEAALKELYGSTFDGVLITRGTGQKTPVTVQDVISALRPALKSTTDRVAIIETDPS